MYQVTLAIGFCYTLSMSSVAGWLSKEPQKLSKIIQSFAVMREELPSDLHYQADLGSQVTFLFEELNSGFNEVSIRSIAKEIDVPVLIHRHNFNDISYVELRLWLKSGRDFIEICNKLEIGELSSKNILAEQTGEWHENSYINEPGFAIQSHYALAACGNYGWAARKGPQIEEMKDIARTASVADADVEIVLAYIRKKLSDGCTYTDIIKKLNMYLFSIVFDFSKTKLKMIGLKRLDYADRSSPYDHLFYFQSPNMVCMARTQKGIERMGIARINIRPVGDSSALELTLE